MHNSEKVVLILLVQPCNQTDRCKTVALIIFFFNEKQNKYTRADSSASIKLNAIVYILLAVSLIIAIKTK